MAIVGGGGGKAGGGGGAGTPAPAKKGTTEQQLRGQLLQVGLQFPFDIGPFIRQAIKYGGDDPVSYAYSLIVKSKQFRYYYQGIFDDKGVMRMTPAQYDQFYRLAQAEAAKAGFQISRADFGQRIVGQGKSLDELKWSLQAAQVIRANQHVFDAFNKQLIEQKLPPIRTAQDALNFLTGKASKKAYDVYEAASIQAAAESAGVGITGGVARRLADQPELVDFDEAEKRFREIAQQAEALGDDQLRAWGLSRDDLATVQFGGPNRSRIALVLQRALQQVTAPTDVAGEAIRLASGRPVFGPPRPVEEPEFQPMGPEPVAPPEPTL